MPRCCSCAPRKKLPPPITTATCTPSRTTSAIWRATRATTSGSNPTWPPPNISPPSLSSTREYLARPRCCADAFSGEGADTPLPLSVGSGLGAAAPATRDSLGSAIRLLACKCHPEGPHPERRFTSCLIAAQCGPGGVHYLRGWRLAPAPAGIVPGGAGAGAGSEHQMFERGMATGTRTNAGPRTQGLENKDLASPCDGADRSIDRRWALIAHASTPMRRN